MKPFNLDAAKRGEPVRTRDGRSVRVLCADRKHNIYPVVVLVSELDGEFIMSTTTAGRCISAKVDYKDDLFMWGHTP